MGVNKQKFREATAALNILMMSVHVPPGLLRVRFASSSVVAALLGLPCAIPCEVWTLLVSVLHAAGGTLMCDFDIQMVHIIPLVKAIVTVLCDEKNKYV